MEKRQIPIYFDAVQITAPAQLISAQNQKLARLKVAAFTKYGNRNGSYITDAVAASLIETATTGYVPVVGFFDPSTQTWAGHTGPKLANGYGYIESFLGWEPLRDSDGITREYAIFSVVLFTDYFTEAQKIQGQNQSMELDPDFIDGDWTEIDGIEYFVYTKARMLGFCIIGDHEPCFSVSAFFSKSDDTYTSQFDKFSSLLSDIKAQVEEAEKGGQEPMNEFENEVSAVETEEFQAENEVVEENISSTEEEVSTNEATDEFASQEENEVVVEENEPSELDTLRAQFEELQKTYQQLQETNDALQAEFNSATEKVNTLTEEINTLTNKVQKYEAQITAEENANKEALLESYQALIEPEQINQIKEKIQDFSYDELESKLAVAFARKQMATNQNTNKVPVVEEEESSFALFMKKYKKN